MSRKSLWCIAPSPAYVRRGCLSLPSNYGSSSSSSQPRTSRCGIQSFYFRAGVTEVLARVVLHALSRRLCDERAQRGCPVTLPELGDLPGQVGRESPDLATARRPL